MTRYQCKNCGCFAADSPNVVCLTCWNKRMAEVTKTPGEVLVCCFYCERPLTQPHGAGCPVSQGAPLATKAVYYRPANPGYTVQDGIAQHWAEQERAEARTYLPEILPAEDSIRLHGLGVCW